MSGKNLLEWNFEGGKFDLKFGIVKGGKRENGDRIEKGWKREAEMDECKVWLLVNNGSLFANVSEWLCERKKDR